MKRLAGLFAAVSLALTGCGGSLCEKAADSVDTFNEKAKPCGVSVDPITDAQIKTCEANESKCTDADKKALDKYVDCIADLDKCSPGSENTFASAVQACTAYVANVSDACGDATSNSVGRAASHMNENVSR